MSCLTKFLGDTRLACGAPSPAPLNKPVGAYIIHAVDIASFTAGSGGVATISRVPTTRAVPIEAGNNALVITVGLKGGDTYAQVFDVTAEMTFFVSDLYSAGVGPANRYGPNTQIVLAVDHGNGIYKVYGLGYPLDCLSMEGDTTGNGFPRVTYGVEDWQVGTSIYSITKAAYDALAAPAPQPEP